MASIRPNIAPRNYPRDRHLITAPSTLDAREYWRAHGTSWRSPLRSARRHCQSLTGCVLVVGIIVMLTATCPTCGSNPCASPVFCALCRKADAERAKKTESADIIRARRLLNLPDYVSFEAVWNEINTPKDRAAASTVEALMLSLRIRGTAALEEPATKRRLSALSDRQVVEVGDRLQNLKPEIARAWSPEEIKLLLRARTK